jgi:hypothetical protein
MNKYQSKVPKFKDIDFNTMKIGKLLQLIKDTQKEYDDFNKELIKNASISLRGSKTIVYDEKNEKYLPKMVTQIYDNINNKLATLPVQIENSSTLLDVVNYVLPNGLQGRVAVDSEGIAEGGLFLNYIQEMIIRLCKIIFPPNRTTYMIKDECLGPFAKDNEKEELIKDLSNVRNKYNKLIDNITKDYNKYQSQIPTIKIYEDASMKKMGMLCGNIPDYLQKIQSMNMDEFTISRIKGLINIYNETNDYLEKIVKNASSTSDEREEFTKELASVKDKFIELNAIINNSAKYQSKMQAVNNYINNFNAKVRKVCTGISNYMEHLNTNNFYKFSTSMIKSLVNIYYEVNGNLNNIINST